MRFLTPLLFAIVSFTVLVASRTNWFANGFGMREVYMLEDDWERLHRWLEMEPVAEGPFMTVAELTMEWKRAQNRGGMPDLASQASISRDQLSPEARELMSHFQQLVATGKLDELPITGTGGPVHQLGKLELRLDDLTSERMEQFLTWTHKLQRGVSPVGKQIGIDLGILALERCKKDVHLTPWQRPLPPPR